jgi:hypothetical protein
MKFSILLSALLALQSCHYNEKNGIVLQLSDVPAKNSTLTTKSFPNHSWQHFLQSLSIKEGAVLDYKGLPVLGQSKSAGVVQYDVGLQNLQQCADALIRLRAEYLFSRSLHDAIGFHFTSGHYFSWRDYCAGKRVKVTGNSVQFYATTPCAKTHSNLRNYLNIVYAYAGTISLATELKHAEGFEVGTVIITPGSPGHCCIIVDETMNEKGERLFKLVEGYTPAQSIYLVSNPFHPSISPWYKLEKGIIRTASYTFSNYVLKKFE